MVTREERIEQLYKRNKTGIVMLIGTFLIGLAGGLWFFTGGTYEQVAAFVFFFVVALPLSFVAWRKTRTLLTFNEDKRYRRWIRLKGFLNIVLLIGMMGMMSLFTSGLVLLSLFTGTVVSLAIAFLLIEMVIDRRLLQIDDEHVVDSLIGLTKRERLKRKWENE
ncbi:hypothetical protein EVJ33_10340 [Exiguobacterium sp. SL-10]|uniref:hypothetical protein n=1 Tax=Exiguobacterium sp. SL-10 TaxID=2510962 RepID=UPI00103C2B42|nr:hypothetical protein [Exiguobacterium sp. SL-10]TCI29315.1 hypothetical protein EVJ33_10340 [Exiguobacterium sp. SL-10]